MNKTHSREWNVLLAAGVGLVLGGTAVDAVLLSSLGIREISMDHTAMAKGSILPGSSREQVVLAGTDGGGQIAVLVYDPVGPDRIDRIGDIRLDLEFPRVAAADIDDDSFDEIIILGETPGFQEVQLLVYDLLAPNVLQLLTSNTLAATDGRALAAGNIDGAAGDDIVIALQEASGDLALLSYRLGGPGLLSRFGDERVAIGVSPDQEVVLAVGDALPTTAEEIVLIGVDGAAQLAVLIYDYLDGSRLGREGDIRIDAADAQVALANLDLDPEREIVVAAREGAGAAGDLALLIYDMAVPGQFTRIGDDRFSMTSHQLATGNLDRDAVEEIALAGIEGGQSTLRVHDLVGPDDLRLLGMTQTASGSGVSLAVMQLDWNTEHSEVLFCVPSASELALLGYKMLGEGTQDMVRIADLRYPQSSATACPIRLGVERTSGVALLSPNDSPATTETQLSVARASPDVGSRNLMVVLIDSHRPGPGHERRDVGTVSNEFFGAAGATIKSFFSENSGGQVDIQSAGVLGWYDADYDWDFYDRTFPESRYNPNGTNWQFDGSVIWTNEAGLYGRTPGTLMYVDPEGYVGGRTALWAEGVRKAAQDTDFSTFDLNGDGILSRDELGVVIVYPDKPGVGVLRDVEGRHLLKISNEWVVVNEPLIVDNVTVPEVNEFAMNSNEFSLGLSVHEICHLLFETGDMYFGHYHPYAAQDYSIMDNSGAAASHLDPAHKMDLNWVEVDDVAESGRYQLADVETSNRVLRILSPERGEREYFIVENRQTSESEFEQLADSGLAVWRVIEDPDIYNNKPVPEGVDPVQWAHSDWIGFHRRGVELLRPVFNPFFHPHVVSGNVDGDPAEELVFTDRNVYREAPLAVFDYDAASGFTPLGGIRVAGTRPDLVLGNFRTDPALEAAWAVSTGGTNMAVLVYELHDPQNLIRVGDARLQMEPAYMEAGDVDSNPLDEVILLAVSNENGDGPTHLVVIDGAGSVIATESITAKPRGLAVGDVLSGGPAETVLALQEGNDGSGRIALLVYSLNGVGTLVRVGDVRIDGTVEDLSLGQFDVDSSQEIVLAYRDPTGNGVISVYDLLATNVPILVGSSQFQGGNVRLAVDDLDGDSNDEIAAVAQAGLALDGNQLVQVYEQGGGGLTKAAETSIAARVVGVAIADVLAGNGHGEIVANSIDGLQGTSGTLMHLYQFDGSSLQALNVWQIGVSRGQVGFAERDLDGRQEIILASENGMGAYPTESVFLGYEVLGTNSLAPRKEWRRKMDQAKSLWDGADSETGYDLVSGNDNVFQTPLNWTDGTPSGICITNISGTTTSSTQMAFDVSFHNQSSSTNVAWSPLYFADTTAFTLFALTPTEVGTVDSVSVLLGGIEIASFSGAEISEGIPLPIGYVPVDGSNVSTGSPLFDLEIVVTGQGIVQGAFEVTDVEEFRTNDLPRIRSISCVGTGLFQLDVDALPLSPGESQEIEFTPSLLSNWTPVLDAIPVETMRGFTADIDLSFYPDGTSLFFSVTEERQ